MTVEQYGQWDELIANIKVNGSLPISFTRQGHYVVLTMPVVCVDEQRPIVLAWRRVLCPWRDRWSAERLLLEAARDFYFHELCEQLRVYGARPFVPDEDHGNST